MRRPSSGWLPSSTSKRTSSPRCRLASLTRAASIDTRSARTSTSAPTRGFGQLGHPHRHRVLQRAGRGRVSLRLIGVEEAVRCDVLDHLGELPAQVHRVLDTQADPLPGRRAVDVGGIAGQQHPPDAVRRRLPGRVAEPRDRRGVVHPEVGAEHRDQGLAEVGQGGFARGAQLLLGDQHLHGGAVADGVQPMDAGLVDADALRRLVGDLHLGDQGAPRRLPAGELDPGCLADRAASAVGRHQVRRTHGGAVPPAVRRHRSAS